MRFSGDSDPPAAAAAASLALELAPAPLLPKESNIDDNALRESLGNFFVPSELPSYDLWLEAGDLGVTDL